MAHKYLLIADSRQDNKNLFDETMSEIRTFISSMMDDDWDMSKNPRIIFFTNNLCGEVAEDLRDNLVDLLQSNIRIPNPLKDVISQEDLVSDIFMSKFNLVVVASHYPNEDVIRSINPNAIFPETRRGIRLYNMHNNTFVF